MLRGLFPILARPLAFSGIALKINMIRERARYGTGVGLLANYRAYI